MASELIYTHQSDDLGALSTIDPITLDIANAKTVDRLRRILTDFSRTYSTSQLFCMLIDKRKSKFLIEIDINFPYADKNRHKDEVLEAIHEADLSDDAYEKLYTRPGFHSLSYGLSLFYNRNVCILRAPTVHGHRRHNPLLLKSLTPYIYTALNNIQYFQESSCRHELSVRETEVLEWMASGKTNKEIAMILDLSQFTIKNHVANIYSKLTVVNRAQAIEKAIRLHYLNIDT